MDEKEIYRILLGYFCSRICQPSLEEFEIHIRQLDDGANLSDLQFFKLTLSEKNLLEQILRNLIDWQGIIMKAVERGIQFTYPSKKDYPDAFYYIQDSPFFLTYIGKPVWSEHKCFAVVGSREPSSVTEKWCEVELAQLLQTLPIIYVSGGARGVDQLAHRLCVRLSRPTVAFLPSGIYNVYPQAFSEWIGPILEVGGAVVSEFSPNVNMKKYFFQRRNRLIAGMGFATLIVEAKRKSGTYITAKQTVEQGKQVFVVPSHPLDIGNLGGLDLIAEGAVPVRDAQDLSIYLGSELKYQNQPDRHLVTSYSEHH